MTWKTWSDEQPPEGQLVLVDFGDFYPMGLRSLTGSGDLYDEYENFDDSEIEPERWHALPERAQ